MTTKTTSLAALVFASLCVGGFVGARFIAKSNAKPASCCAKKDSVPAAKAEPIAPNKRVRELHVPKATEAMTIDGELEESAWSNKSARTNAFVWKDGQQASPYSDARLLWGDGVLYVGLYAADEDIRAKNDRADGPTWLDDSFHLELETSQRYAFDVSPKGVLTDAKKVGGAMDPSWESGASVGKDLDGTMNDPSDDDEEWVIEMKLPLSSIGLKGVAGERVTFAAHRCDSPKRAPRTCAAIGEDGESLVLVLDP
jgi:hypothetical protein